MDTELPPAVSELVAVLRKILETAWSQAARSPNGLDAQLKKNCAEKPRNIWLDGGFQAWFAYTFTKPTVAAAAAALPDSLRQHTASLLCAVTPHPTVHELFQHILYKSDRGQDRRSWLKSKGFRYPENQGSISSPRSPAAPGSPGQQSSDHGEYVTQPDVGLPSLNTQDHSAFLSYPTPSIDQNTRLSSPANDIHKGMRLPPLIANKTQSAGLPLSSLMDKNAAALLQPGNEHSHAAAANTDRREYPQAKSLYSVFPRNTCDAIVTTARGAEISIIFHPQPSQCNLRIGIEPTMVPYVARELFGASIFIDGKLPYPYITLDSSVKVGSETLMLVGADHIAAEKFLGLAYREVVVGRDYMEERDKGRPTTDLMTMEIRPIVPTQGTLRVQGWLTVQGEAVEMSTIATRLWPYYPWVSE